MIVDISSGRSDIKPSIVSSGPRAETGSETPHQRHQTALYLDAVRPENAGLIGLVSRLERNRGAAAPQPFQRDFLIVDQRYHHCPVLRGFAALDDDRVPVEDACVDHAVASDFEGIMLAAAAKHAGRHPDCGGLVA